MRLVLTRGIPQRGGRFLPRFGQGDWSCSHSFRRGFQTTEHRAEEVPSPPSLHRSVLTKHAVQSGDSHSPKPLAWLGRARAAEEGDEGDKESPPCGAPREPVGESSRDSGSH